MNLNNYHNIYFLGIGGIGMSALAHYFVVNGKQVGGYDKTPSAITTALQNEGADLHFEDDIGAVSSRFLDKENTLIVYTPAISISHTEYNYFVDNHFTVVKRAALLGAITKNSFSLAVAGTHGKTTTSSILGHIMHTVKATSFLGGIAENYNSNLILGASAVTVVEADEFDRSFLQLSPNIACITSMDADHLDIYGDYEELKASFLAFSHKVTGTLIVAKGLPIEGLTYAIDEAADYTALNVKIKNGAYVFDVQTPTTLIQEIAFSLPGKHNVMNALAALAMADVYGISAAAIKDALQTFAGVQRRFSYKIKTDDLILIDDYAHHPTEISAVENSIREMYPKEKVLCIFQPHLFSRTRDFAEDFATALSKFDELILLDIYPARELPIPGITSAWLLAKIAGQKKLIVAKEDLIKEVEKSNAKVVVMLGAGDIGLCVTKVKEALLKKSKHAI